MKKTTQEFLVAVTCISSLILITGLSWGLVTDIKIEPVTSDNIVDPGDLEAVTAKISITDDGNEDQWFFLRVSNQNPDQQGNKGVKSEPQYNGQYICTLLTGHFSNLPLQISLTKFGSYQTKYPYRRDVHLKHHK